eukprot:2283635-Pleurochrysis_carterae.AAC.1
MEGKNCGSIDYGGEPADALPLTRKSSRTPVIDPKKPNAQLQSRDRAIKAEAQIMQSGLTIQPAIAARKWHVQKKLVNYWLRKMNVLESLLGKELAHEDDQLCSSQGQGLGEVTQYWKYKWLSRSTRLKPANLTTLEMTCAQWATSVNFVKLALWHGGKAASGSCLEWLFLTHSYDEPVWNSERILLTRPERQLSAWMRRARPIIQQRKQGDEQERVSHLQGQLARTMKFWPTKKVQMALALLAALHAAQICLDHSLSQRTLSTAKMRQAASAMQLC